MCKKHRERASGDGLHKNLDILLSVAQAQRNDLLLFAGGLTMGSPLSLLQGNAFARGLVY